MNDEPENADEQSPDDEQDSEIEFEQFVFQLLAEWNEGGIPVVLDDDTIALLERIDTKLVRLEDRLSKILAVAQKFSKE